MTMDVSLDWLQGPFEIYYCVHLDIVLKKLTGEELFFCNSPLQWDYKKLLKFLIGVYNFFNICYLYSVIYTIISYSSDFIIVRLI